MNTAGLIGLTTCPISSRNCRIPLNGPLSVRFLPPRRPCRGPGPLSIWIAPSSNSGPCSSATTGPPLTSFASSPGCSTPAALLHAPTRPPWPRTAPVPWVSATSASSPAAAPAPKSPPPTSPSASAPPNPRTLRTHEKQPPRTVSTEGYGRLRKVTERYFENTHPQEPMNPEPEILSPDIPPSPVPVCGSGAGVPPAVPNSGAYQPPEAEPFPPRPPPPPAGGGGGGGGGGGRPVPLPPSSIEQPASDTPDPAAAIEFAHACNGGVPSPPPEERAGLPSIGPAAEGERRPDTSHPARSPRGKIARLPKATRDKLNFMLRDGLEHKDILAQLGDAAKDIIPRNVSNWLASPSYQRWLLEQDWLENLRADQESAFDLTNDFDASKFNEAALQLAVTRLFLAFRHLDSGALKPIDLPDLGAFK